MIRILELLEETYPSFYHAGKLTRILKSSLDGEFSKIIRYLKATNKIIITLAEDEYLKPMGYNTMQRDNLLQQDGITITPGGIDFLIEIKQLEMNEKRNMILIWSTVAIAFFAFVSLIINLLNIYKK